MSGCLSTAVVAGRSSPVVGENIIFLHRYISSSIEVLCLGGIGSFDSPDAAVLLIVKSIPADLLISDDEIILLQVLYAKAYYILFPCIFFYSLYLLNINLLCCSGILSFSIFSGEGRTHRFTLTRLFSRKWRESS